MRLAHATLSVGCAALLLAVPTLSNAESAQTTVVCKDGTTSKGGKGACSGHGGVDKEATKAGKQSAGSATAATPPAAATAPAAPAPVPSSKPATASTATAPASANATNTDPTGAIAKCKDGTYSHAQHHSGACSRHGGVAEWLDKPAK